ncbi:MAG: hypothetical protein PHC47_02595 [Clostridia bacterium]|nr:hypothetical protein [Clostridia bacterium]
MKKILNLFIIFALTFPALTLSACVGAANVIPFVTESTKLTSLEFFNYVRNQQDEFFDYAEKDAIDSLSNSEKSVYESIKNPIQEIGNRIYMVMPALDFYLNEDVSDLKEFGFYSLDDIEIRDYTLVKKDIEPSVRKYYKKIEGNVIHGYLPIVNRSHNEFLDDIDNTISTWGNAIDFEVSHKVQLGTYEVKVSTGFYYPSAEDVPARDDEEIKIVRNYAEKEIVIVYNLTDDGGIESTYSKVISFTTVEDDETGELHKVVEKYSGDYTTGDAIKMGDYEYLISNTNAVGTYTINFNSGTSYLYVRYSISAGNYWIFETYDFENSLISRHNNVRQHEKILSYDFYMSHEGVSGRLKHFETNSDVGYISEVAKLNEATFAKVTESDREDISLRKISFEITNKECHSDDVGYL